MEVNGLKMNTRKMKVMFSCCTTDRIQEQHVCKKGVGNNSILCMSCQKWVHKRCAIVECKVSTSTSFVHELHSRNTDSSYG